MQTKLTVRVESEFIEAAKEYAKSQNTSLSQLIEGYLKSLAVSQQHVSADTPVLQRLTGILPADASLDDYHRHLEEKYG